MCIGKHSIFIKASPRNRSCQNWFSSFFTNLTDISNQIIPICRICKSIAIFRIDFLIIMTKLNNDIISRFYSFHHHIPTTFGTETLRASAIHRMILKADSFFEIKRKNLPPTFFRVTSSIWLIRHGGVSDQEKGDFFFYFIITKNRRIKQGECCK